MRSRSASAAAARRRATRGRVARESRARKRTLLSRVGFGPLAPFVAGAPLAAGRPREPLRVALPCSCSVRLSERTDLALSTRLASRRSTGTSSESWPEPLTVPFNQCSSGLQRTLLRRPPRFVNRRCRAALAAGATGRAPRRTDRHRLDRCGNRPDQRSHPPHGRHTRPLRPPDARLHRPQTRQRQDHQRRHPLPQTPPRPPPLARAPDQRPRPESDDHTIDFLT
jgi:hypothetical protein